MLAMMVAALSFTACGGDDDDEIGDSSSSSLLTVTRNGKTTEYGDKYFSLYDLAATCKRESNRLYFLLGLDGDEFLFNFPYSKYGDDFQLSSLYVGFSEFPKIDWYGYQVPNPNFDRIEIKSGSVIVTENTSQYITIKFENYTFIAIYGNNRDREFIINGLVKYIKK